MKKRVLSFLLSLAVATSMALFPASALEVEDARQLLRDHYVDEIPEEILSLDSLEAILSALNDPYTVYLSAEDYQDLLDSVNGASVVGIGVSIQTVYDEGFQILAILPNSPAQESGLEAGDRVVAVDGVRLTAASDVTGMITGEEGTPVTITAIRQSTGKEKDFTLTRRKVTAPIVTYAQEGTVGFIDCSSFGSSTVSTMEEAILTLEDDITLWTVDLRSNPGGSAQAAAGAVGLFAGSGNMVYFRDGNDEYSRIFVLPARQDLTDKPLILLTSPYSASGAELFAAAIRDLDLGIAIGQRTVGKGVAQNVYDESDYPDLFDGDGLKITNSRFFSPNGTTNHIVGILPTLMVESEHTETIARLLSAPQPGASQRKNHLKLHFDSCTLYLSLKEAMKPENQPALAHLLEAIPSGLCTLERGTSTTRTWEVVSPRQLALELGLEHQSRGGFSDLMPEETYSPKVETLASYHLVSGYGDGTFRPENPITRAEFCALVATALDLPANSASLFFSDTDPAAWYADSVSAMAFRGFIKGYEDGTFRPNAPISYQEMAAILSSAAIWLSMDSYEQNKEPVDLDDRWDFYTFDEWAVPSARILAALGVDLDHSSPNAPATRAQAAEFLFDFMDNINLLWGNF